MIGKLNEIHEKIGNSSPDTVEGVLEHIMKQSLLQKSKKAKGNRFQDPVLIRFAMNIWILGGRRAYEVLQSNFQGAFPSPRTIEIKLSKYESTIVEGNI